MWLYTAAAMAVVDRRGKTNLLSEKWECLEARETAKSNERERNKKPHIILYARTTIQISKSQRVKEMENNTIKSNPLIPSILLCRQYESIELTPEKSATLRL